MGRRCEVCGRIAEAPDEEQQATDFDILDVCEDCTTNLRQVSE